MQHVLMAASRFRCFWQVMVPLSGTALATLAVFIFLFQWNNLLWPLIMSSSDATVPIAVGLRNFQGQFATAWNLLMAAATLATIPVIALYMFTQRWFVKGIVISGFVAVRYTISENRRLKQLLHGM